MPIRGVTDEQSRQFGRGFARLGRLYKGDERSPEDIEKNRPGPDLKHFRVEFEPGYTHLEADFLDMYGDRPTEFPQVFLVGESVDQIFPTWLEQWGRTGLIHRCDGVEQIKWFDASQGRCSAQPIPCAQTECKCKPVGRLNLILGEFVKHTGAMGYFSLNTHSEYDVRSLTAALADIQTLYNRITGIPFIFGREAQEVSAPKMEKGKPTGERIKTTKSLLFIRVPEEYTQQHLIPALVGAAALPSGDGEVPISPEEMKRLQAKLGAGDTRRLGGTNSTEDDEPEVIEPNWSEDYTAVIGFLAWAKGKFKLDEPEVIEALQKAVNGYPVAQMKDWRDSKELAMAAVIAQVCRYDEERISNVTNNQLMFKDSSVAFDIYSLACEISERLVVVDGEFEDQE